MSWYEWPQWNSAHVPLPSLSWELWTRQVWREQSLWQWMAAAPEEVKKACAWNPPSQALAYPLEATREGVVREGVTREGVAREGVTVF